MRERYMPRLRFESLKMTLNSGKDGRLPFQLRTA